MDVTSVLNALTREGEVSATTRVAPPTRRTLPLYAAFIAALLILGVWFRFYHLECKLYGDDEVYTSLRIAGYTRDEVKAEQRPLDVEGWRRYQRVTSDRGFGPVLTALLDDMHPPLYFVGAHWWAQWLGSSAGRIRAFSALISLMAFPCLYWLCWELFESPMVSWIALVLFAVSPFHVLYAQEARPYSLWTVTILASSAALLRALRVGSLAAWALYGVATALGIYAHYLAVILIPGHGLYAWAAAGRRARPVVLGFGAALGLALLLLTPWLAVARRAPGAVFTRRAISALTFIERWLMNVSSVFFDPQIGRAGALFDAYGHDVGLRWDEPSTYVIVIVAVLGAYSLYALYREAPRRASTFVFVLVGVCLAFLAVPDLVKGGQRSTTGRYLIPLYIGLGLAVAHLVAVRIGATARSAAHRWAWRAGTVALLAAGVLSCAVSARADAWWSKYASYHRAAVARFINAAASPLVLVGGPIPLLGLTHVVRPVVTLQLAEDTFEAPPAGFSDVFVYVPARPFLAALAAQTSYRLTPVSEPDGLWRLEPRELRATRD